MSKQKDETHDRIIVPEDFRALDNVVRYVPRDAPSTDICESPTHTIVVNEEWAKHIYGAIETLTLWKAWTGDTDERNAAVQQVMKLLSGECVVVDDCDFVASCIETSEATQAALVGWSNTQVPGGGNIETPLPPEELDRNLYPDEGCSDDLRYGMAVGIVQAIHDATWEIFQAIDVLTSPLKLEAEVADNAPLIEAAFITLEYIIWIQETAATIYFSAWSDAVKDELACEIFCAMKEESETECILTFNMIWDIYKRGTISEPPDPFNSNLGDWFSWIEAIPLEGTRLVVGICGLAGLLLMRYGGQFSLFVAGIRSLETTMLLLADEENDDWEVLCTECNGTWVTHLQFDEQTGTEENTIYGAGNWSIMLGGVHTPGQGWTGTDFEQATDDWRRGFNITQEMSTETDTEITQVEVTYTAIGGNRPHCMIRANLWADTILDENTPGTDVFYSTGTISFAGGIEFHLQMHIDLKILQTALTGYCYLSKMSIYGAGTQPPELIP